VIRPVLTARTASVDATRELAGAVAELARSGDLLILVGDLGAGKTAFTQGFGSGLGVPGPITSPTFALVQSHRGRLPMHHLDVYRLGHVNEALDLGLEELLDEGAVTLIEWGDTILRVLPHDFLEVHLLFGEGPDDRVIELVPIGTRWSARMRALETALRPWCGDDGLRGPSGGGGC
jgi:tRNA threonylcarbamoyladenosine biosynthesis protein TsaE